METNSVGSAVETVTGTLTGYAGLALTGVIACIVAGLGIWGIMYIVRQLRKGASAGSGR